MASFTTSTSLRSSLPSYSPFHFFYLALKSMANSINRDQFPVGFRFYPTDEELIHHYLKNKVLGNESLVEYIRQIDTCKYEPWDLPGLLSDDAGIEKWFFFSALDFKNYNSSRCSRTTKTGFWKSTGKDRKIMARGTKKPIATKKTLVFHRGRGPNGNRTNWVIHEYRLQSDTTLSNSRPFVICSLKKKSDKNVSKFDQPNGLEKSTFENVGRSNEIQESSSLWHPTGQHPKGQPAFPDFQPINASDRQSIQPGASADYFNSSELLDLLRSPRQPALPDFQFPIDAYEYYDDATSKMSRFASYSEPEPALMDFQPANGIDVEVNNQPLRPGASESEFNLANCLNSLENESRDEVTSTICIDSHAIEEPSNMLLELKYNGFSSDTDNDAVFRWQNNHVPPSYYPKCSSSAMQNIQTIKELRRSPLTGKRFQYREEKEIYPHEVLQASSCGSIGSTRNVFSYIITTKRIQHKSSHPLVYVAKAFLGIILFVVLAQEVLLYGY